MMSQKADQEERKSPKPCPAAYEMRRAGRADYHFALALYVDGSAKHLQKIGRWDEARILRRFERAYDLGVSHIIGVDGREAGYLQVVEFKRQIYLRQLHLADFARNRGIGAHLIEQIKARGVELGKPVTLDVLHGNRACELYLRLGFQPIRANLDKTRMIWRLGRRGRASVG